MNPRDEWSKETQAYFDFLCEQHLMDPPIYGDIYHSGQYEPPEDPISDAYEAAQELEFEQIVIVGADETGDVKVVFDASQTLTSLRLLQRALAVILDKYTEEEDWK